MPGSRTDALAGEAAGSISVVIPALNEAACIGATLQSLAGAGIEEIILVDGGSSDGTAGVASALGAKVLRAPANRGTQQNLGAKTAKGSILLFLHADTILPPRFADQIRRTLARPGVSAGAFRFRLDNAAWQLRLVERMVALRCRLLQLPYGDQAIFMARDTFERAGRFAELQAMEDFDLVRRLRRLGRIALADGEAITSARRWQRVGMWKLTWLHQLCILGYYLKFSPQRLARWRGAVGGADG